MSVRRIYVARVVLEATSPLAITTGSGDGVQDNTLVRDANGLPAIPGSSLAGALRALAERDDADQGFAASMFGAGERGEEQASALRVSWGALHDAGNQPVQGLLISREERERMRGDALLSYLSADLAPTRDRVRLNHRGVVDARGKYDVSFAPAGCRWSVELSYDPASVGACAGDPGAERERWERLLSYFKHPAFRLGSNTRSGFGAMKAAVWERCFDLSQSSDFEAYANLGAGFDTRDFEAKTLKPPADEKIWSFRLHLHPEGFWRIGNGVKPLKGFAGEKDPDMTPKVEPVISWNGDRASIKEKLLVPGSGIKGALRHRTAFHYNILTERWALGEHNSACDGQHDNEAVRYLFGSMKEGDDGAESRGCAGRLQLSDVYLDLDWPHGEMLHSSIDRFTGGVRRGALFSEQLLWGGHKMFDVRGAIIERAGDDADSQEVCRAKEAFRRALSDLCEGRLTLGAGASRGHGVFSGSVDWDHKDWCGES